MSKKNQTLEPEAIPDQDPEVVEAEKPKIVVRFLGGNERFWTGVPARDMTAEDWGKVDTETQNTLIEIKLYELIDEIKEGGE
jgi:hypothetical protein